MKVNLPPKIRMALYIFTLLGTPVVAFLFDQHYINQAVVNLWLAEVTVVATLAAFNVNVEQ